MPRVVHFEIHVDDPDRAGKFYREVFDWRFQKWEGPVEYWLITTGDSTEPGIDGGMMRRRDPQGNVYNTIAVNNIDASIASIEKHGGTIVVPKMPISGVGWLAYFKDTEGNIGGVMQTDHNAK
ncbi:MAG: VOC family protein [candidate division Zixibacteria bacterium]|nr:VOC family protein [candidate division Zixibacteria bacterium]